MRCLAISQCLILLALLVSLSRVTRLGAQDVARPILNNPREVIPSGTTAEDEESTQGTFARTLVLTVDREIEVRLRSAHTAFQIGNSAEGVRILAELLTLPETHLIEHRSTYRDIREEVVRLLRTGSQDLRDQFLREIEVRATAELQNAVQSGDLVALRQILAHYPLTPSAREAAQRLSHQQFDHGDFAGARQTASRWIESAADPVAEAQLCEPLVHLWQQAVLATEGPTAARDIAARFKIASQEPDYHFPVAVDSTAPLPETAPTAAARWQVDSPFPASAEALLQEIVEMLRRNGVYPQLSCRPLSAGDQLFWRSPNELVAVRSTDGTVLWRVPVSETVFDEVESSHARPNENLRERLKFQLGHRLLRDSIHGELSCDSERVYSIEQAPDYLPPLKNEAAAPNDMEFRAPIPARTIVARSRSTGETLWKSHEIWGAGHQGLYIFGPPSSHKSQLFAVIQNAEQLVLVRVHSQSGKLEAEYVLGECTAPMLDRRRLNQSVPIVWNADQALCATGAGAIVAVNLSSRQLSWAFRHPRHDNAPQARFLQVPTAHHSWRWFSDWRQTQLIRQGERLVYATPESQQLRCLSVESGELLWEVPGENSIRIVAVDSERVLVQTDHGLRSYRLTNGTLEVEYRTSAPVAAATWDGTSSQLTLDDGQQQVWDLATNRAITLRGSGLERQLISPRGTLRHIQGDTAHQLRSVSPHGPNPITITTQGVSSGNGPPVANAAVQIPAIDWEAASAAGPVQKLIDWIDAAPAANRMEHLRLALAECTRGIETSPEELGSFERLLREFPAEPRDQVELTWRLLRRSLRDERTEDAVRHLLALLQQDPTRWEVEVDANASELQAERPRTVRLDAALRGALHRLWQRSSDPQRQQIETSIRQWASHPDTIADQQAEALQPLSFWNPPVPELAPADTLARLAATQFRLMQSATRTDRSQAAAALLQLAEFQLQRGDRQHASALLSRLQKQVSDNRLPDGFGQLQASAGADVVAWPTRQPLVADAKPTSVEGDSLIPVPIRAERGSAFDRIDVLCPALPQRNIRFAMDGKLGWDSALPVNNRDMARDHALRRGWAFGQFVVLQLGSELYCIASQKIQGTGKPTKTKEQFLWPRYLSPTQSKEPQQFVDTLGTEDNRMPLENRAVPQFVGFSRPATEIVDPHGRRRTWVGPVSAGITCFLQQGMLVCLETSTGQELWRRYNMPAGVRCYGDERVVAVIHDDSRLVDWLSPLDGQTLRTERLEPEGELLHHWGRHLLIASGQPRAGMLLTPRPAGATAPEAPKPETAVEELPQGPAAPAVPPAELLEAPTQPLQLSLFDLEGMKTIWSRTYPAGSVAFEVDEEWLGVLHAPDKLELLDWRTGDLVSETPIMRPAGLIAVSAAVSDQMIYVSLSSAPTVTQLVSGYRPGWRWPLTNGPVHALNRLTGKQGWTRVIENRGLPLSQPRDVPLLVFCDTWRGSHPDQDPGQRKVEASWSRYLFLDSRSGETLHESVIRQTSLQTPHYATMDKDRKAGRVDVKLDRSKIRFDYAPKPE